MIPIASASTVFSNVVYCCLPDVFPVGQETGAACAGGAAVQGLGRSGAVTPGGNMNSATGVTGRLPPRPAPPRPAGGGGMVAAEQRGTI